MPWRYVQTTYVRARFPGGSCALPGRDGSRWACTRGTCRATARAAGTASSGSSRRCTHICPAPKARTSPRPHAISPPRPRRVWSQRNGRRTNPGPWMRACERGQRGWLHVRKKGAARSGPRAAGLGLRTKCSSLACSGDAQSSWSNISASILCTPAFTMWICVVRPGPEVRVGRDARGKPLACACVPSHPACACSSASCRKRSGSPPGTRRARWSATSLWEHCRSRPGRSTPVRSPSPLARQTRQRRPAAVGGGPKARHRRTSDCKSATVISICGWVNTAVLSVSRTRRPFVSAFPRRSTGVRDRVSMVVATPPHRTQLGAN